MKVWSSYKTGEECVDQQRSTFSIVRSLTDQERMAVFRPEQHRSVLKNSRDRFDIIPEFIKTLTPEVKKGFDDIWVKSNMGEDEKLEQYVKEKFTAEQKIGFEEWMDQVGPVKRNRKEVDERIKNLSPKAKEILKELIKIRTDEGKILQQVTPQLATELYGFI
uniref:DUF148 domain-containing protein n=1 Tax=Heterorhabditis bacteriophora TaxID=37862 RepID=A0A1I7WPB8_HETBA